MAEKILKRMNSLVTMFVAVILIGAGAYSVYALWDNQQVYAAAQNVQDDLLALRPDPDADNSLTFEELRAINPDVCAWITIDNTEIDYPVLQGEDNLTYINTDVYGNFALAGSIFLDASCDNTFHDSYSLIYGHHMAEHQMFGDLDLYEDEEFFNENTTGVLMLPDRTYELEIFAYLLEPASETVIFNPEQWKAEIDGLLDFADSSAVYVHEDVIEEMRTSDESPQVVALSTCSTEYTDARTIILARMVPYSSED